MILIHDIVCRKSFVNQELSDFEAVIDISSHGIMKQLTMSGRASMYEEELDDCEWCLINSYGQGSEIESTSGIRIRAMSEKPEGKLSVAQYKPTSLIRRVSSCIGVYLRKWWRFGPLYRRIDVPTHIQEQL